MDNQSLGNRLRLLRINHSLSQENLADQLNLTQSAYSKLERGERKISIVLLYKMAAIYQVNLDNFWAYIQGALPLHELLKELEHAKSPAEEPLVSQSCTRIIPIGSVAKVS